MALSPKTIAIYIILNIVPIFLGYINIQHPKDIGQPGGLIRLNVNPDGGIKRSLKTLSGGEKSFSTVALVLALWDVIKCPFRILDEFDVFMDHMNREATLEIMSKYITNKKVYQYVFLTPLSLDCLEKMKIPKEHVSKQIIKKPSEV